MGCGSSVAGVARPPSAEERGAAAAAALRGSFGSRPSGSSANRKREPHCAPVAPQGDLNLPVGRSVGVSYGSCTIPGFDPPRPNRPNQDAFVCLERFGNSTQSAFAVLDGHGALGQEVAGFCRKRLPANLAKSMQREGTVTEAMAAAFADTQTALRKGRVDCTISGSAVSMALLRGEELFVANAGDCRVVLGRERGSHYEAIDLSVDHKPDRPDERERLLKSGARVEPVRLQSSNNFVGPMRVWKKMSNVPGLAVSRSMGDLIGHTIGVLTQPEFTHTHLDEHDHYLILASDGVWEWLSSQDAVDIVSRCAEEGSDASVACEQLARAAYARWEEEGNGVADDTTAVVVYFVHDDDSELAAIEA